SAWSCSVALSTCAPELDMRYEPADPSRAPSIAVTNCGERSPSEYAPLLDGSAGMRAIRAMVERIADTDATVLIRGGSGAGKDLVARGIHAASRRCDGPFIKVNCAAVPPGVLESELFGHEKGAFTGAYQQKPGAFEAADHGTLLLNEIGEMPP